jgi:alkanesulfonate monooxygenase SsuD/methylene tetrahydromethanopterin reductase-like flavin-dependent oxidoreductase (luciferase family)
VFLGALSQATTKIRLGHGIMLMLPKYNHPARCAERIATLDCLSGGRVEWGTGESGTRVELEAFDIPYVDKREMWIEAVRVTARMLASTPYGGHTGKFFSMPARNIVPKPVQKPHPPLWVACSTRAALQHAARHGLGALTFAFMDAKEARFWVEEYYETFERECRPLGLAVNPNVAMLVQFMCDRDHERAETNGLSGSRFFAFGLAHYYRTGSHVPGRSEVWRDFEAAPPFEHAGNTGIGRPDAIGEAFERFEEAGVDQLILLHQAGRNQHSHVCESLELFGDAVLPAFRERDAAAEAAKAVRLQAAVATAEAHVPPLASAEADLPKIDCYPLVAKQEGADMATLSTDRSALAASIWRLQVGGPSRGRNGSAAPPALGLTKGRE